MAVGGVPTEAELAELRAWVPWDPPTTGQLEDAYAELGGIYQVAEREIRRRLMERAGRPDSFTIPGDYSERTGDAMEQLRSALDEVKPKAVAEAATLAGTGGGVSAGRVVRVDSTGTAYPRR